MNKKLKWLTIIGFATIVVIVGYTLYVNFTVRSIDSGRDKRLDIYESTKAGVISDMRSYLTIKNDVDFDKARRELNFTQELKDELLGDTYNSALPSYSSVQVLDISYSFLDDAGSNRYNLLVSLTKDGKTKTLTFIVFVEKGKMYDLLIY